MKQKLLIIAFIICLFAPFFHIYAGTILSAHKYAWSNNVGYINFESVSVSDSALGGYAWSANKGFIKLNPALGGVLNDGTGNLSGFAWGEQLGWIDFGNVSIDSNGKFTGTAAGALAGTITFDCNYCDVQTDWRKIDSGNPDGGGSGSGGGGGIGGDPAIPPIPPVTPPTPWQLIDINKDGIIGILDFNQLMVNWGSAVCGNPADISGDCSVGMLDYYILMAYWGTTY